MDNQVFISYKRADKGRVFQIKDYLEKKTGLKFWVDLDGIESADAFKRVIIKAIKTSPIFLFFYSKEHLKIDEDKYNKDWTIRELNFAEKYDKKIVIVNIDGTSLIDTLEFDYGGKQQVDARDTSRLDRLALDIRKWLNTETGESQKDIEIGAEPAPKTEDNSNTPKKAKDSKRKEGPNKSPNPQERKIKEKESRKEKVTREEKKSQYADLPNSIAIQFKDHHFLMVLSDDRSYYIGNLRAKDKDLSWIKNNLTMSEGSVGLGATAIALVATGIFLGPLALLGGSALAYLGLRNRIKADHKVCRELAQSTGFIFSLPSPWQLKGVKEEDIDACVVLNERDNPRLFNPSSR